MIKIFVISNCKTSALSAWNIGFSSTTAKSILSILPSKHLQVYPNRFPSNSSSIVQCSLSRTSCYSVFSISNQFSQLPSISLYLFYSVKTPSSIKPGIYAVKLNENMRHIYAKLLFQRCQYFNMWNYL